MTGPELAAIRHRLGLSAIAFGRACGYTGTDNSVSVSIRRYEGEYGRPVPPLLARLAVMFDRFGVPDDFWPEDVADDGRD
ncbi:helix-turn-helix domain-containing protein [Xanthobacter sediminis]